jgi:alkylhydroperoxidase family enzyme
MGEEKNMALRVSKAEIPESVKETMIDRLGAIPENVEVLWHSPAVAQDSLAFGGMVGRWDAADPSLKTFAHMTVAAQVGCSWCLDVAYFQAQNEQLDLAKASQVPCWRQSEVFTALERDVMDYAEAMTATPPTVTDAMVEGLLAKVGAAATVELTTIIAFANQATRANVALGVTSQGFSRACEIPLAAPTGSAPDREPV